MFPSFGLTGPQHFAFMQGCWNAVMWAFRSMICSSAEVIDVILMVSTTTLFDYFLVQIWLGQVFWLPPPFLYSCTSWVADSKTRSVPSPPLLSLLPFPPLPPLLPLSHNTCHGVFHIFPPIFLSFYPHSQLFEARRFQLFRVFSP